MRECVILPTGRLLNIPIKEQLYKVDDLCTLIKNHLNTEHSVSVFNYDSTKKVFVTPEKYDPLQQIYVLLRLRGGGKGGFRKQLEKKAREFSRAKSRKLVAKKGKREKKNDKVTPAVSKSKVRFRTTATAAAEELKKIDATRTKIEAVRSSVLQGARKILDDICK